MLLYIIRHGETYGNINGDGFAETDLTPKGRQQIAFLGKRFKDVKLDKIYSSPLVRAVKTSNAIRSFHPETPLVITSCILERGTDPDYIGLPNSELLNLCPDAQIEERFALGNESPADTMERAVEFIEKIKRENEFDSTVAIVAHGTLNSYLVLAAIGFPYKENFNFSHINTGVSLVAYIKEENKIQTKLKYLNDSSHLL